MSVEQIRDGVDFSQRYGVLQISAPTTPHRDRPIAATGIIWHGRFTELSFNDIKVENGIVILYPRIGEFVSPTNGQDLTRVLSDKDTPPASASFAPMAFAMERTNKKLPEVIVVTKLPNGCVQTMTFSQIENTWNYRGSEEFNPDQIKKRMSNEAAKIFVTLQPLPVSEKPTEAL